MSKQITVYVHDIYEGQSMYRWTISQNGRWSRFWLRLLTLTGVVEPA